MPTLTRQTVEQTIYGMLTESTGAALCDSGGAYGRHWERNQKKSLEDLQSEPEVKWDGDSYTISVFHYLMKCGGLELDDLCNEFNAQDVEDWDGDCYGVSKSGQDWLDEQGFIHHQGWNTYNGETSLSQVLQGHNLELNGEQYVLLQIHQGCDVRGGYTDAKLFRLEYDYMAPEQVLGTVTRPDGETISVDNFYNGYNLTDENGQEVEIAEDDQVDLYLIEHCG
jgi:hypothetical protein